MRHQLTTILLLCTAAFHGQERGVPEIRNFSDYGAHHQNWAIVQDSVGLMYFGNNMGVLQFDGASWQIYRNPRGGIVRSLELGYHRKIYVGANNEFGYFQPDVFGRMKWTDLSNKLPDSLRRFSDVWRIVATDNGVFFQTTSLLFLVGHNDTLIRAWKPKFLFRFPFLVHGRLFVHDQGLGLLEFTNNSMQYLPFTSPLKNSRIYAMLPLQGDSILIQTRSDGTWVMTQVSLTQIQYGADSFLRSADVYGGMSLGNGDLLFWTLKSGLVLVDPNGNIVQVYNKENGLQDKTVHFAFLDRSGSIWTASNRGISRIEMFAPISLWREESGVEESVWTLTRHGEHIYAGTSLGILKLVHGTKAIPWKFKKLSVPDLQCWSLLSMGSDLIAATSTGIWRIRGDQSYLIDDSYAFALAKSVSDSNIVLVGLQSGYGILRRGTTTWNLERPIQLSNLEVRYLNDDEFGNTWLSGTFSGFIRIDNQGRIRRFGKQDGPLRSNRIFHTSSGLIFISLDGIQRYNRALDSLVADSTMMSLFLDHGSNILRIAEDTSGSLWLAFSTGTGRLQRDPKSGTWKFTALERIAALGDISTIFIEGRHVWYGGYDGIFRYRSAQKYVTESVALSQNHPATILSVRLGKDSLIYVGQGVGRNPIPIDYRHNEIDFTFADPAMIAGGTARFRYRLDGLESEWSETPNFKKAYSYLPEGTYTFMVRPAELHFESSFSSYTFTISPPFFRTWWAYGLYGVVGLAFVMGIVKTRNAFLERDRIRLRQIVEQQTTELRAKNDELARLNEKKNEFLGIVAHDLRNPITGVMGFASLLEEEFRSNKISPENAIRGLRHILKVSEHMHRLVTELLDISSIEAGKVRLDRVEFDLQEVVTDCIQLLSRHARQKDIQISWTQPSHQLRVFADPFKIRSVMDNLVSNAIKYTGNGGNVTIVVKSVGQNYEINVIDNGQGLSEEDLKRVFTSFGRLSSVPTAGESSNGLGLVIVKKIVEIHGGRVWVTSKVGHGSTFGFSLPAVPTV